MFYCIIQRKDSKLRFYFKFKSEHKARSFNYLLSFHVREYRSWCSINIQNDMKPLSEDHKNEIIQLAKN